MATMPLTLVLGPANAAKAAEVLGAYPTAARRDALLVVPTAADAAHYDRELAAPGITLGRALTFSGLVDEIARRTGQERPRLTPLQRERVIRRVISSLSLTAIAESARRPGFAIAATALVAELRRARVSAPRFAAAMRSWAQQGGSERAPYARDLASLYHGYIAALERLGRTDAEGLAWEALDALRARPDRWHATPVFLYGFDDLTEIEQDAIETLSAAAGAQVTVSLTYERDRPALAARAEVVEDLRERAASGRELPALDEHYAAGSRVVLHHLERHLFESSPPRIDPGEVVTLLEAGGERAEAELIAAEVLAALRDGVSAAEIVVVCRSLQRSGRLLARTLQRYGVPATGSIRVPLVGTALGRALFGLTRCALDPRASAADLLCYLRAPGVLDSPDPADDLAAEIARLGVTTAADARRLAGNLPLGAIDELRRAADPAAGLARQARRLFAAPRLARAAQLTTEEALDARAAAAVLLALEEAAEVHPLTAPELVELLETLDVDLDAVADPGAVLIAEPLAIRARRFRRVLIAGLCEGEFPSPAQDGDPFLGEDRRRELALASGLALRAEPDQLARERYLLYACVSRATERVCFSYRSSDEDGNLVLPSPFLADLDDLFEPAWRERRRRRLLADVVWSPDEAPTPRERRLALAAVGSAADPAGSGLTRRLGEAAMEHVRHRQMVSANSLEKFAGCPVKWLVESQLKPADLAPDDEPLAAGKFIHGVLERVISGLGAPLTDETLPQAELALAELTAEPPAGLAPGRPEAVRAAILRGIEADLRRYLRFEAGDGCDWAPTQFELEFMVEIGAGDDAVGLRGFVDRVDVDPATGRRAIIRDYKSGVTRLERAASHWLVDHQLQVGLYMLAVRRQLGLEPVAGFYQPLTGRDMRPRGVFETGVPVGRHVFHTDGLSGEELQQLLADVEEQALALAAQLRTGELTPCPETCSRAGCRHPGICWAA